MNIGLLFENLKNLKALAMTRSERRHRTFRTVQKRSKVLNRVIKSQPIIESKKTIEKRIGRCKKHSPLDCGVSNCVCCHSDKIFDEEAIKYQKQNISFKEFKMENNYDI